MSTVTLRNATISGNSSGPLFSGSNIYGAIIAYNSIIANGLGGSDCSQMALGNNNWFGESSCAGSASPQGDPLLGPLADNGGPTQTHTLLEGSGAIDAGDDAVCAATPVSNLDQRGITLPVGEHCDIGAFERTIIQVDGDCSLVDAIESANTNTAVGGCSAGNLDADTIVLQNSSKHALTISNNTTSGSNGLPVITTKITIQGNNSTIKRDGAAPAFRLFQVVHQGS